MNPNQVHIRSGRAVEVQRRSQEHGSEIQAHRPVRNPFQPKYKRSVRMAWSTTKLKVTIVLLAVVIGPASLLAQDSWQIDPQRSVASLSVGSGQNTLQMGVARVSGDIVYDSKNPDDPSINFAISSRNSIRDDYASINFLSHDSYITSDGRLIAKGKLTVTRTTRPATSPNQVFSGAAFSGPVHGPAIAHTSSRRVTLVFSDPRRELSQDGRRELTASISANRETFPELLDAAVRVEWPTELANDKKCTASSPNIEDYSGQICTGKVIAKMTKSLVPIGTPGEEDFSGFGPAISPDRKDVTIILTLRLEKASVSSAMKR
jgi:hypothetical protein